jgi:hypothetical protein
MDAVRAKLKEAVAYIDRSPKLVHSITSSPAVYERRPPPTSTTTARLIRCSNLDLLARWRDHCLPRFVRTHDQKSVSRAIMRPPASISARCEKRLWEVPQMPIGLWIELLGKKAERRADPQQPLH